MNDLSHIELRGSMSLLQWRRFLATGTLPIAPRPSVDPCRTCKGVGYTVSRQSSGWPCPTCRGTGAR